MGRKTSLGSFIEPEINRGSKGNLPWLPMREVGTANRAISKETIRLKEYNALASDWFGGISAEAVFYHAAFAVVNKKTLKLPLGITSKEPILAVRTNHGSLEDRAWGLGVTKTKDSRQGSAPVGEGKIRPTLVSLASIRTSGRHPPHRPG